MYRMYKLTTTNSFVDSLWHTLDDESDRLEEDAVRVEPNRVHFEDAYEGKQFVQKITIQNCGKNTAFVRVGQASSFAFELSPVRPRGEFIPPGLIVKRTLKYMFSETSPVQFASIPIYINSKEVLLKVKVSILSACLSVDRYLVDFGQIDIGPTPASQSFTLTNTGSKAAKFAVDVGQNEMKCIVSPIKGTIEAHSSVLFSIEIVCTAAGNFDSEIWLKCMKPIRIRVAGVAQHGNLELCNKEALLSGCYNIIDMPRTYYGSKSVVRLILKNNSASRGVYCVMVEDIIEEANETAILNFQLNPSEGRIGPHESIIIHVTFQPNIETKKSWLSNEDDHRYIIYRIRKLGYCKDINIKDYPGGLFSMLTKLIPVETSVNSSFAESENSTYSSVNRNNAHDRAKQEQAENIAATASIKHDDDLFVCMHADVEQAHVTPIPNELLLKHLKLNETVVRTVQFHNRSVTMPVYMQYQKIPFIEVRPVFVSLKPDQSEQVEVIITPGKFGTVRCTLEMQLLFYNQPRYDFDGYTPVGMVSVPIKFSTPAVTSVKSRKGCCNDIRLTSEEYVKSKPTIIQNPVIQNMNLKHCLGTAENSYKSIARSKMKMINNSKYPDYDTMAKGDSCNMRPTSAISAIPSVMRQNGITPLTPKQMNNVEIDPIHLNIGYVAAYSRITKCFNVINNNDIPISIVLVPEKKRFVFPDGDDKNIEPLQRAEIPFSFFSEFEGLHSLCIRIVVNRNHIYEVTMQAQVVARALSLDVDRIIFNQNDPLRAFIDLSNPLNIPLPFNWDISNSSCIVDPANGIVGVGKDMTCVIYFNERKAIQSLQDVSLVTDNANRTRVYVIAKTPKLKLELSTNTITFSKVPLNYPSTRCLVLKNDSNVSLQFKVANATPVAGMTIEPKDGIVPSKGIMIFKIRLQGKRSMKIDSNVNLILNQTDYLQFRVLGEVVLPRLVIKPASIHFKKIPTTSFDVAEFYVHNKGLVACTLKFSEKKLTEWKVLKNLSDNQSVTDAIVMEPKSSHKFYIQYNPLNTTNHWFYLPVIVNNCLGDVDELYSLPSRLKLRGAAPTHSSLPHLKLFNVAYESNFEISKIQINFSYFPYNPDCSQTTDDMFIHNTSAEAIKFCIRTDDLYDIFDFEPVSSAADFIFQNDTICFTLGPGREMTFKASYHPKQPGKHSARLSIYVQNDNRVDRHNYIILSGFYQEPVMHAPQAIYFGMLPLYTRVHQTILIHKDYHNTSTCVLSFEIYDTEALIVYFDLDEVNDWSANPIKLVVRYSSCTAEYTFGRIVVSCTCGCTCNVKVLGCVENSIMTNYAYIQYCHDTRDLSRQDTSKCSSALEEDTLSIAMMEEVSPFPRFPDSTFENQCVFIDAVLAVEDWLLDFVSSGRARHLLPDSVRHIPCPNDDEMEAEEYYPVIPYLELLEVLGGEAVISGFNNKFSVEPIGRACAFHCLYENVLQFLMSRDGYAPHVQADFLLDHEDYCIYREYKGPPDSKILTVTEFHPISKQCWLDVLLQTIKVFVISRIKERNTDDLKRVTESTSYLKQTHSSMVDINNFYKKTTVVNSNYFSYRESILLKWLEYHFYTNIFKCCPTFEDLARFRFDNFDSALADSIVLATVIIRYCPYLQEHLTNLYWKPKVKEEFYHNAAKVLKTLARVNNCFSIEPQQLCNDHHIKKMLFVAYLYEFLPGLEPLQTIQFNAPLSQSAKLKISVRNDSDYEREYKALVFGDTLNSFVLKKLAFVIEAKKHVTVEVTYTAKFAKMSHCTLLLSGEAKKKGICQSVCYSLEGVPDIKYMSSTFQIALPLYSRKCVNLEVVSPYKTAATFEILVTRKPPNDINSMNVTSLQTRLLAREMGRLNTFVTHLTCDANGVAQWELVAIALTILTVTSWFYFHNDEIGDFAVQIDVSSHPPKLFDDISIHMPNEVYKRHCICYAAPNINCSRYVKVKIPRKNFLLRNVAFEAYRDALVRTNASLELVDSPKGRRIIGHLLQMTSRHSPELQVLMALLNEPSTFQIKIDGPSKECVKPPKTFSLKHVNTIGTENMLMHIDGPVHDGLMLTMTSGVEVRNYRLHFDEKQLYKKIQHL